MNTAFSRLITRALLLAWLAVPTTGMTQEPPGFTITGNLATGGERVVSAAEIEKQGVTEEFTVFEPYEKKPYRFSGVWLRDFVQAYGKPDTRALELVAIDDYMITFKRGDWEQDKILLATRTNGKPMNFDAKGPVRIVYPHYDPQDVDKLEQIKNWIWMITDITFLK